MAAENITRLRVIQPRGPYYLAGACFGALVAYEMARQLARADERVALLMLLDPSAPFSDRRDRPRRARPIVDRLIARTRVPRFVWGRLRMLAHAMMDAPDGNRVALLRTKLGVLCGIAAQRDLFRGDRRELHAMGVLEANRVAARRYVPGPYDGPTILCLTSDRPISGPSDRRLDWLTVVPKASLRYVPGLDSGSMLHPPYVSALAANMNEWLGYARTGGSKEPAPAIGTAALAD